jgi:small glutamine-rich tetratricopeptide repeat-containing protein alpha
MFDMSSTTRWFCLAQSIGEAFGIDPSNQQQRERLSVKPANLQSIFDVYVKTRDKMAAEASAPPKPESPGMNKAQADKLKQIGNSQMSRKEYAEAIESYTEAISLDSTNAVYYSNRAAAHSSLGDHQKAVDDAEKAIETDPNFVKAFSRLG